MIGRLYDFHEGGPAEIVGKVTEQALVLGNYLARIAMRATHDVGCWIDDCKRRDGCLECPLVGPLLK